MAVPTYRHRAQSPHFMCVLHHPRRDSDTEMLVNPSFQPLRSIELIVFMFMAQSVNKARPVMFATRTKGAGYRRPFQKPSTLSLYTSTDYRKPEVYTRDGLVGRGQLPFDNEQHIPHHLTIVSLPGRGNLTLSLPLPTAQGKRDMVQRACHTQEEGRRQARNANEQSPHKSVQLMDRWEISHTNYQQQLNYFTMQ